MYLILQISNTSRKSSRNHMVIYLNPGIPIQIQEKHPQKSIAVFYMKHMLSSKEIGQTNDK